MDLNEGYGVFDTAAQAIVAAHEAFGSLDQKGSTARKTIVEAVKGLCQEFAVAWGRFEIQETGVGRFEHKVEKLQIIPLVQGVESLDNHAMIGDCGVTFEQPVAWGVIGSITPLTHVIPTIAANIINMVAAGNTVVFNPHPNGVRSAILAIRAFNYRIEEVTGLKNVATMVKNPTVESFNELCAHPLVRLLSVTGGPGVVKAALNSGKQALCAGPGNPPVVVDETADLDRAAEQILLGAAYDNNLLCIGEKEIFVVDAVFDLFIAAFKKAGAFQLNDAQMAAMTKVAFLKDKNGNMAVNRDCVGRSPSVLAKLAGFTGVPADCQLLFAVTDADHIFVQEEQMMPVIPVVRVANIDEAISQAKRAEKGCQHSAMIHSHNTLSINRMSRELNTTIFTQNGSCLAGLGIGGEGYLSFTILTNTGQCISTPNVFTRKRRFVSVHAPYAI